MTDNWLPIRLPHGLGDNYAMPKTLGLTSLFSSYDYGRVPRPVIEQPVELASYGSIRIKQISGHQLDQPDASVFMQLVNLSMDCVPVQVGAFTLIGYQVERNELLRLLGRTSLGGGDKRWLQGSLDRLVTARFAIELPELSEDDSDPDDDGTWRTGLIHEWSLVGKKTIRILLNYKLARLYADNAWSLINRQQRQALKGDHMALWLLNFYSAFKKPNDIHAQALRKPMGREGMRDDKYLASLRTALATLAAVTGWACELKGGYVAVKRRQAKTPDKMDKKSDTGTATQPVHVNDFDREELITSPVAIELESWMHEQPDTALETILSEYGLAKPNMSRVVLESGVRSLYLDGNSLALLRCAATGI